MNNILAEVYSRLYNAKLTSIEMMTDRGYDVRDENTFIKSSFRYIEDMIKETTIIVEANLAAGKITKDEGKQYMTRYRNSIDKQRQEFKQAIIDYYIQRAKTEDITFRQAMTNVYENKEAERCLVYFADDPQKSEKLGVNELAVFLSEIERYGAKRAVLITPTALSADANKRLASLTAYDIQIFFEDELTFNVTRHIYVPKHELVSKDEQERLIMENKADVTEFPILKLTDPIARYYNFKPGDLIKIHRFNLTEAMTQHYLSYRIVRDLED